MKKFIVLSIVGLLVLSFGTTVFAQAKKPEPAKLGFKASGFIDAAYFGARNVPYAYDVPPWQPFFAWAPPLYGPPPLFDIGTAGRGQALDKERSLWQSRARLKLDAVWGKELSGTIFFEMDSGQWGEAPGGRNQFGRWSGDQTAVEIKNLYFDFAVPAIIPIPVTVRVGLQPLAVRPHMVALSDGMGITAAIKVDPATISLYWFKALENLDYASDDVDVYGLQVAAKIGKITAGGYGLYYNENTYPLPSAISSTVDYNSSMWWLGVFADGKLGPVDLNFDFVYDRGKVEDQRNIAVRARDAKYRGWATRLKVDYPWEKFNFGVVGMYASGSDQKKTNNTGLPGTTTPWGTTTTKVGGYVVPNSSEQFALGDSLLISGTPIWAGFLGYNVLNYTQMHRGSIGGTWIAKLYGSYKATPWYKVTLAGLYIGDTTKNGNTIGNARTSAGRPRDDKTIGFEFDLINEINIYKNLKWDIGFGYLFAGDALEYYNLATGRNKEGKDPWAFVTKLTYTF
jgi:hypothetical protein